MKELKWGIHIDVPVLFVGHCVHELEPVELPDGRHTAFNVSSILRWVRIWPVGFERVEVFLHRVTSLPQIFDLPFRIVLLILLQSPPRSPTTPLSSTRLRRRRARAPFHTREGVNNLFAWGCRIDYRLRNRGRRSLRSRAEGR
jgi:hypothetical protein